MGFRFRLVDFGLVWYGSECTSLCVWVRRMPCLNVSKELIVLPFVCLLIWFFLTTQRDRSNAHLEWIHIHAVETALEQSASVNNVWSHAECAMHTHITHMNAIWFVVHGRLCAQCNWRCGAVQMNETEKKFLQIWRLTLAVNIYMSWSKAHLNAFCGFCRSEIQMNCYCCQP